MAPLAGIAILLVVLLVFLIPIIAILSEHQQKMARIMRDTREDGTADEVRALREDIRELKALVHESVIAADGRVQERVRL